MAGGKYRSFLVHIKAVSDKGLDESLRPVVRMPSVKPHSSKAHSLSSLLQRSQANKVPETSQFYMSSWNVTDLLVSFNSLKI